MARLGYSKVRAPQMPKVSIAYGLSAGQKLNNRKIEENKRENARVAKIHAEGQVRHKSAAISRGGGSGGGIKHRRGGTPRGGQFY